MSGCLNIVRPKHAIAIVDINKSMTGMSDCDAMDGLQPRQIIFKAK